MQLTNTNMFLVVSGLLLLSTLYIIYQNNNNSKVFGELVKNVKDLNSNTRNYLDGVKSDLANTSNKLNKQVSNVEQLYLNNKLGTPEELDRKLKGQYEQYNIPAELIENENVEQESDNMDNTFFDEDTFNREIMESSLSMNVEADDESEINEIETQSNGVENEMLEDSNSDNLLVEQSESNDNIEEEISDNSNNDETIELNQNDELDENLDENQQISLSIDKETLEKMTLRELKAFASTNKIVQKGTKGELLDRVKTELNLI